MANIPVCNLIGFNRVEGENKEGRAYKGYRLYFTQEAKITEGISCNNVYVSDDVMEDLKVGDSFGILYNKYGRVCGLVKRDV